MFEIGKEVTGESFEPIQGIYEICCTANNRIYVGQSTYVQERLLNHFTQLVRDRHPCNEMQRDWNRYGASRFSAVIVRIVLDDSLLLSEEKSQINRCYAEGIGVYNKPRAIEQGDIVRNHKVATKDEIDAGLCPDCGSNRIVTDGKTGILCAICGGSYVLE